MKNLRCGAVLLLGILTLSLSTLPASARVIRVQVFSRTPVLSGRPFGPGGPYEEITARVYFAVRPGDPHDRNIVDLNKAPRNAQGEVEFSSDLFLLRPIHRGNGALLLEIPNRGGKGLLRLIDGGTPAILPSAPSDFGDAWLLKHGYTIADLGWQWDVTPSPGNLRLYAPIATNHGSPITGVLRDDFTPVSPASDWPLGHVIVGRIGGTEYPVSAPSDRRNVLTVRDAPTGPRHTIPRSDWSFSHAVNGAQRPSNRFIHLNSGFRPGRIYELVYVVRDPVVAGLGFAAVRDFVSWLKYQAASEPPPLAPVQRAYALGISQCGRFLRDYLYEGFNQDESGRMALDGVLAHVGGAGRGSFNYRFAQPSRDSQPMSSIFWPTDIFPFTDEPEADSVPNPGHAPLPAQGLLDRAKAEHAEPKLFLSHTSYEYWGRAASLITTTADGRRDMPIGHDVRVYFFAGLQHFSGPFPPQRGSGQLASQNLETPLPIRWFWRAMISNMNAWVRDGIAPPPSSYPHVSDGTLVPIGRLRFPAIPGIHAPHDAVQAFHLYFGPHWRTRRILTLQPPRLGSPFPVLVPQVDGNGNAIAGIHLPEIAVPLATYTGWNFRAPSTGAPTQRVSFLGSDFPFARTAAERQADGDPRLSIAERYSSRDKYLTLYQQAAEQLVRQHWILPEDLPAVMQRGGEEWDYYTR